MFTLQRSSELYKHRILQYNNWKKNKKMKQFLYNNFQLINETILQIKVLLLKACK